VVEWALPSPVPPLPPSKFRTIATALFCSCSLREAGRSEVLAARLRWACMVFEVTGGGIPPGPVCEKPSPADESRATRGPAEAVFV